MNKISSGLHLCASTAKTISGAIRWGIRVEALVRVIAQLVTALAATAFAHFGVTLKTPVQHPPQSEQTVQRVPISDPAATAGPASFGAPCPISVRSERT